MNCDNYGLLETGTFEKYMSCNTWWVPVNTLGEKTLPTFLDYEIIAKKSPEDKKEKIHSLYDAILLFIASHFHRDTGVQHKVIQDIEWELYQSGRESVLKNSGCCSSCAAWLCYMLKGKYDEVGMLLIIRYAMSGHCINYIIHNGTLYFIDMETFLGENLSGRTPETGKLSDFRRSQYVTNIFTRSESFENYASFHMRMMRNIVKDAIFVRTDEAQCIPVGYNAAKRNKIYFPEGYSFDVIPTEHPCGMQYEKLSFFYQKNEGFNNSGICNTYMKSEDTIRKEVN